MNPSQQLFVLLSRSLAKRSLLSVAIFYGLALHAFAQQFGDFTYTTDGTSVTITDYPEDAVGAVVIPFTIDGKPVTGIGDSAFDRCSSISSVTIPPGVTIIGTRAFNYCDSLVNVNIPDGVTSIGTRAFGICEGLTSIIIPDSVTSIGISAFFGCDGLTSINIPDSVVSIGQGAFADCASLLSITVAVSNPNYKSLNGVLFNKVQTLLIRYPGGKIGSYTIPDSVVSIGQGAFGYSASLTSVTISDSVTNIGNGAFILCTGLTNVSISDSLVSIGREAFRYCFALETMNLPSSVTTIETRAFTDCTSLTSITVDIPNPNYSSSGGVLFDRAQTILMQYPSAKLGESYSIPESTQIIGGLAFHGCTNLTAVTIPDSVTTIEADAFRLCRELISITIPNSVTSIERAAFYQCSSLTSVTILSSITTIEEWVFSGCSSLTSISIPESVTSINSSAFSGCSSLTSIVIPESVITLGDYAFNNSGLERADFLGASPTLGSNTFSNTAADFAVYYFEGAEGFTSPTWEGYPSLAISRGEPSSGQVSDGFLTQVEGGQLLGLSEQADGGIILTGDFTSVNELPRSRIAMLNPDGVLENPDSPFAGGIDDLTYLSALQADGQIIIAGRFRTVGGQTRSRLARLDSTGSLESLSSFQIGSGANGTIDGVAIQPDGKIIVVGAFTEFNGEPRNGIVRLLPDGSLESEEDFQIGSGLSGGYLAGVALQDDQKILLWGDFDSFDGQPRSGLARLRTDGSLEGLDEFDVGSGAIGAVRSLALQNDGKIIIGGTFTRFDGQTRNRLARLQPDGSLEGLETFQIGVGVVGDSSAVVSSIALQADGKILLGGRFERVAGESRNNLARLLPNGSVESRETFHPGDGPNGSVNALLVKQDGGILVGGPFDAFDNRVRKGMALLHNDEATRELIVPDPTRVRWLLGGGGAAVSQVSFDYSTDNGMNWIPLGPGVRIDGGWERSNLNLPQGGLVRATGTTRGGYFSSSTGIAQQEAVFLTEEGVFTQGVRDLTAGSVTLVGAVSLPEAATAYFEYGSSPFLGQETGRLNAGGEFATELALPVEGLSANTKYYYRAVAVGPSGRTEGVVNTFTTRLGAPLAATGKPADVTNNSATLVGGVNPQGLQTEVFFEYGATVGLGSTTSLEVLPAGLAVVDVTAPLMALATNGTYHYRIVASNSVGEVRGEIVDFQATPASGRTEPTARPILSNTTATAIEQSSAIITGQVDARGGTTLVSVEYGLNSSYGSATVPRGVGNGEGSADIAVSLANLLPGTSYHFRVVATNSLGTQAGSDGTFRTADLPPEVATGAAAVVNTTTVEVKGAADPKGISAEAYFDYGTSRDALNLSVATTPARIEGNQISNLAAKFYNLRQGVTYYYQIRAISEGGTSRGDIRSFEIEALSGLVQTLPKPVPQAERSGFVLVNLTPSGIASGWRFAGETRWRANGVPATGLTSGDRRIEFRPLPGYRTPAPEAITVTSGEAATFVSKNYVADAGAAKGSLRVILKPDSLASIGLAQWRLLGETTWRDSDASAANLAVGFHVIECKPVSERRTPSLVSAEVRANLVSESVLTYFLAGEATGTPAEVLPYDLAAVDSSAASVGQLRSSVGSGTGFAVSERVVATAGHVVFDDSTLTFVPDLEWLFQRDADIHEPLPQAAQGVHLMTGYAARRTAERTPGTSSPQSQSLDVAAVYFAEEIGRGAQSGYLASDLAVNEYLTSTSLKTLVGYPVEGVPASDRGRLHATPPGNVSFTAAGESTYSTRDLLGLGGLSGAPLCVARENGTFYPAGIYLGGDGRAVVRAIDSRVTALFREARISATGGGNNTGGGITLSTVVSFGEGEPAPGALKVIIEPASAREAGAAWALGAEGFTSTSGNQRNGLDGGVYDLTLKDVPGFRAPTAQVMQVTNNQLTTITFTYAPLFNAIETWRVANFGSAENTGTGADEADPDGDGASNLDEYGAGTNPNDANDFLQVLSGTKSGLNSYLATVAGKAGRTYRLAKYSVEAKSWQAVSSQGPLVADGIIELKDSSALGKLGIYRVELSFEGGE